MFRCWSLGVFTLIYSCFNCYFLFLFSLFLMNFYYLFVRMIILLVPWIFQFSVFNCFYFLCFFFFTLCSFTTRGETRWASNIFCLDFFLHVFFCKNILKVTHQSCELKLADQWRKVNSNVLYCGKWFSFSCIISASNFYTLSHKW